MKILFYVSGHGFGHATRIIATMNALLDRDPAAKIYARTRVPEHLFASLPDSSFHYHGVALDIGVVENDIFSQDVQATLKRYSEINASQDHIVSSEVEFIRSEGIDIIVSDIPPLASEAGCRAKVPTIAIGNFSWDFIYEPYVKSFPEFAHLIEEIQASYEKTDLLLRLPFHHEMTAFPRQQDIPLTVRKRSFEPQKTRLHLGLSADDPRPLILLALRMDVAPSRAIQELIESDEFVLLASEPLSVESGNNVRVLPSHWQPPKYPGYPDIVAISDLTISKLGYGIVSECIAGQTPLMYIPRDDFAEYQVLRDGIDGLLPSYIMPGDDFLEGRWYDHVKAFLSDQFCWPGCRVDGAEVAADIILSHKA